MHHPRVAPLADFALYVVVFFSLWSAVAYFRRFWRKVDISVKQRSRHELLVAERARRKELLADRREALRIRRRAKADRARGRAEAGAGGSGGGSGPAAVSVITRTSPDGPSESSFFPFSETARPPAFPATIFTFSSAPTSRVSWG